MKFSQNYKVIIILCFLIFCIGCCRKLDANSRVLPPESLSLRDKWPSGRDLRIECEECKVSHYTYFLDNSFLMLLKDKLPENWTIIKKGNVAKIVRTQPLNNMPEGCMCITMFNVPKKLLEEHPKWPRKKDFGTNNYYEPIRCSVFIYDNAQPAGYSDYVLRDIVKKHFRGAWKEWLKARSEKDNLPVKK